METLKLSKDGKTIEPFEIRKETAMLYVEGTGTLQFHLSTDGVTFTPWPRVRELDNYLHETLHHMKVGSFMKITCNAVMSNPKLLW